MIRWRKVFGLALLSGGVLTSLSPELPAATSSTSDILSNDRAEDTPNTVDIGRVTPIARPNRDAAKPLPGGNPLWSIPLSVLSATQERPIFSASRRAPQQAVVAPAEQAGVAPPPTPGEPERPALALIGAVVGESDAIAVFLDRTSQKIVRLRQGETYSGWELNEILRREVTFKKADRTEVLVLQRSDGSPAASAGQPSVPSGSVDLSYAPFFGVERGANGA